MNSAKYTKGNHLFSETPNLYHMQYGAAKGVHLDVRARSRRDILGWVNFDSCVYVNILTILLDFYTRIILGSSRDILNFN